MSETNFPDTAPVVEETTEAPILSAGTIISESDTNNQPESEDRQRRHWTNRKAAISMDEFMSKVVEPVMGQVAAGRLKKALGMIICAMCGRVSMFPYGEYRNKCKTNPFQTFSADLTRYHKHPAYNGESKTLSQKVMPSETPLEETVIPVYPMFNEKFGVPQNLIDRFVSLCERYGIDAGIFTTTGGEVKLTPEFIKVAAYFASDKGLEEEQKLWGDMRPITHVPAEYLEAADAPKKSKKSPPVPGRKRGRPRTRNIEPVTTPTTE